MRRPSIGTRRFRLLGGLALLWVTSAAAAGPAEIRGIETVYLRSGPSTEDGAIGTLSAGDPVTMIEMQGTWTKVLTADGKLGFVYHRYVVPVAADGSASAPAPVPTSAASAGQDRSAAPAVAAPAADPSKDPLSAELAGLRVGLAELKQKMQERADVSDLPSPSGALGTPAFNASPVARSTPSAREQGVGVLAVAVVSLIIGWALGSAFGRRRTRSQRPRLRF